MVDLASKYRMFNSGYVGVTPRCGYLTMRELYHETGRRIFSARQDRPVHDCRADVIKKLTKVGDWDTWLLSHGLNSTYDEVLGCYDKRDTESGDNKKKPDKLLYCIGQEGTANEEFKYPRGVCATLDCNIAVADSRNHRVQIFNQLGVFKLAFGKFGSRKGEFNDPSGVAELPNGDLAIADRRNCRVQVFTEEGKYLSEFRTRNPPFSVACDRGYNLVVGTMARTVELYTENIFITSFPVPCIRLKKKKGSPRGKGANCPLHVAISSREEIVVCDPEEGLIKVFDFFGNLIRRFSPQVPDVNLVTSPGGIHVTALDQVLVTDTLNYAVNLFSLTGAFLQVVATKADDIGCLNSISVGPEGHMIISEASLNGPHCVKIFRYRPCPCHEGKMGSSKKRTPATSPNYS